MTDTHTHLYMRDAFPDGGAAAVERAVEAGVRHLVLPGVDVASMFPMLELHARCPEHTSVAIGLHPTEVTPSWRDDLREIRYRMADTPYIAWGEIGIDLHWESSTRTLQMDAFGEQLDRAFSESLPVIIHSRDALDETLEVLAMMGDRTPDLLFHSFTADTAAARRIMATHPEALFGINGVATFKNAGDVREAIAEIGLQRIVLETDSPWLAPVPHRGKTNESSFLPHILATVAAATEVTLDEAEAVTDATAARYFRIPE